ncbi:hypothetical protein GCM10010400_03280 [Streptomyces aculeolatus]
MTAADSGHGLTRPARNLGRRPVAAQMREVGIQARVALGVVPTLVLGLGRAGSAQPSAAAPVPAAPSQSTEVEITEQQADAAKESAGSDGDVSRNNVLVEHADGVMDWIAQRPPHRGRRPHLQPRHRVHQAARRRPTDHAVGPGTRPGLDAVDHRGRRRRDGTRRWRVVPRMAWPPGCSRVDLDC